MRVVTQDRFGAATELYIKDEEKPFLQTKTDVLVQVYSTALNRADLLIRQGKYPGQKSPSILGLEMAGIVESVGSEVKKFKAGDKVMGLLRGGGYADFVVVDELHLMPVPQNLSLQVAGSIPEVWLTAFQLIHFVGKLKKGEIVLIHGGGSGVGTAAIQLAKLVGADVLVTAGTEAKINKALTLGASAGFNYKEDKFQHKVLDYTNGKGVNVILDCVGSSFWQQNIASLSVEGRWVLYGLMGGRDIDGPLLGQILAKRASLIGTTLMPRSDEYKANLIEEFSKNALCHFDNSTNQLFPIIDRIFPLKSVVEAHQYMESNQSNGKIILDLQQADEKSEL